MPLSWVLDSRVREYRMLKKDNKVLAGASVSFSALNRRGQAVRGCTALVQAQGLLRRYCQYESHSLIGLSASLDSGLFSLILMLYPELLQSYVFERESVQFHHQFRIGFLPLLSLLLSLNVTVLSFR